MLNLYYYRADLLGVSIYTVPSQSMSPSIEKNDMIIVDTWAYLDSPPQTGDIVVFNKSDISEHVFVKRIDQVRQKRASLQLFLLGDNPNQSSDSRQFGWLDASFIKGKVTGLWRSSLPPKSFTL